MRRVVSKTKQSEQFLNSYVDFGLSEALFTLKTAYDLH